MTAQKTMTCPDCGVQPGHPHHNDCDIQRCSVCGGQRVSCDCDGHDPLKTVWTGQFPIRKNVESSLELAKDKRIDVQPQQCYYNAFKAVVFCRGYSHATYVEGMAQVIDGLMIEHGWLEVDGEILDPTLPADEMVYFPGLRFEGGLGISKAMKIPTTGSCGELPFFHRFGWGGMDSPEFSAARDAAMRFNQLLWQVQAI